jgi:hypothetical protein
MIKVRVLIEHLESKKNTDLGKFLIRNKSLLKKEYDLKVIFVYEENKKLFKKIPKFPLVIIGGKMFTDFSTIKLALIPQQIQSSHSTKSQQPFNTLQLSDEYDLQNFLNAEMFMKDDNGKEKKEEKISEEMNENEIHNRMRTMMKSREDAAPVKKVKEPIREVNDSNVHQEKISDMLAGDPEMSNFFENREYSCDI